MVLIKEFRVALPCSVQEVGQLYSVAEASKNETGGGEGIQVLTNEPYEKDGERGQYTHKIYHLKSKVPGFVRMFAPEGSLVFHEKAWNAYPYCRTVVTNEYMKDDFFIKIETWHKPDLGTSDNVHGLDPNTWKNVEVVHIDIADRNQVEPGDYKAEEDPALFQSVKTKRGPLGTDWKKELAAAEDCPKMCAYKLVTIKFKWWGLQNKIENFIQKKRGYSPTSIGSFSAGLTAGLTLRWRTSDAWRMKPRESWRRCVRRVVFEEHWLPASRGSPR
ncbi:phosphatidylinositol transfer protein beta isoform 2-T2 [Liasis olivaceus]